MTQSLYLFPILELSAKDHSSDAGMLHHEDFEKNPRGNIASLEESAKWHTGAPI